MFYYKKLMKLYSPNTKPQDYGAKNGDYHLVVNSKTRTATMWAFTGAKKLWVRPVLALGQRPEWWLRGGNTPPSVYKLGQFYNDIKTGNLSAPYGWQFYDMIDLDNSKREDGENTNGRSEIGLHGGGSSLPDPQAPYQRLVPTLGCVRMHNKDLQDLIQPLYEKGTVYLSVHQVLE
jgi:hypothetical protein